MFYIFWSKRNQPHNKQGTVGIYDEELSDRLMSVCQQIPSKVQIATQQNVNKYVRK